MGDIGEILAQFGLGIVLIITGILFIAIGQQWIAVIIGAAFIAGGIVAIRAMSG